MDGHLRHGKASASKYLSEWRETWETYSVEVERFIDLGDQVLALAVERGRGRESGLMVETKFAQLRTMRDARVGGPESRPCRSRTRLRLLVELHTAMGMH